MKRLTPTALALCLLALGTARAGEPGAREEAGQRELLRLQGTWQLAAAAGNGPARTLFIGGDVFLVREGTRLVQAGTLRLSPAKKPRAADAIVRKGEHEGKTLLGIYELEGDTLRLCFDLDGDRRPAQFKAAADTPTRLEVYKRPRDAGGEGEELVGRYESESVGSDGKKLRTAAEIQRHGDAYMVRWSSGPATAFVGVGIRRGNTLSVCWANRGTIGLSVYEIGPGPRLVGVFTELGSIGVLAAEQLTPVREDRCGDE